MKYQVRCECGNVRRVGAADAGGSFRCYCGRTVDVPPLHQLRAAAGEDGLSPAFRLEALLRDGRAPSVRTCAVCDRATDGEVRVSVVCERGRTLGVRDEPAGAARDPEGCLLGWLHRLGGYGPERGEKKRPPTELGQDIAFVLPLRVCPGCARYLSAPPDLRRALRTVPEYAAVLDQYPRAEIGRR